TELYRERFVRALARDLQVPLLILDSSVLAPYDFGEDNSENESDEEHGESGEEVTSESEIDDDDANNEEEWTSSADSKSDDEDVEARAAAALKKLLPGNLEEFAKNIAVVGEISSESSKEEEVESSAEANEPLKKGDRVKYVGPPVRVEEDNRPLATGQRGEIFEINGERVAVILDSVEDKADDSKDDEKAEQSATPSIYWIHAKHVERDFDTEAEDCYIAMEALSEILRSVQPLIVYFPDSSLWLSRAVSKSNRKEFVNKLQEMFDKISGPVVLICGQNKVATGSKEKEKFVTDYDSSKFGSSCKIDVKTALHELAVLPMKRPELFSRGNLLRPCKGILLFGPPGTGKTLLAKALATEAGANFISITGSTLTSKWFGDAEKLTKALFSFASKLAPVIVFVDEVDSLLGARGGGFEHEATRRMRNEFMAAWDGLRSKDSQRILILGATNRPFDLDDAVIRRLPRRIYVDLPDADNRLKILKIFLAKENIEPDFDIRSLANATEGYSGSDLKNLCIAAAYRPVQELLDEEKKGKKYEKTPALRPLNLEDFIQSKAKVGPSVAYDAASVNELRKWNEKYGEGGSRRKSPFGF
ncbi:hypothetical protein M8C21_028336, partial [Ambrosia artemisiifolia]